MGAVFSSEDEADFVDSALLVGDLVRVRHLTLKSDSYLPKNLPVGTLGRVKKIDYEGDAYIDFAEVGFEWIYTSNYENLEKVPFPLYECEALKNMTRICILGSISFQDETSKLLVEALASELEATLGPKAAFITAGMPGVQEIFAKNCGDGARVWNVMPFGEGSNYQVGQDVHAGVDSQERNFIVAEYGDIYITVEGGPDVAEQARVATARGAPVIPMMRTGGASSGLYNFPPDALQCPAFVTPAKWKPLQTDECTVDQSVAAAVTLVTAFVASHEAKRKSESIREDPSVKEPYAENLQQRIADLEEQLEALTKLKAADAHILQELAPYKDAHGALKSAYDELSEAHAECQKRQVKQAEEYRTVTESHVKRLQKRIEDLEEELETLTKSKAADAQMLQELTPYKDAHGALKSAYDELSEAHAESQKRQAKQADEDRAATQSHVDNLQKRIADLEEQLQLLTNSKDADAHLVQELTSYKDAHGALKSAYDELTEAHAECQKRHVQQAEEDRVVMESFVDRLQKRIVDLEKQLEALKKSKAADADLVQELASCKDAHGTLKSAYDELSAKHAESQKREEALLRQPVLRQEVEDDLRRRLEEAEAARVNADKMVAELQARLAAASRSPRHVHGSYSMTLPPASGSYSLTLPQAKVTHVVNADGVNVDGPSTQPSRPQGAVPQSYQVFQQPVVTVNSTVPVVHSQPTSPLPSSTTVISPPTSSTVIQGSPQVISPPNSSTVIQGAPQVFKSGGGLLTYGGGGTIYAGQATYGGGGGIATSGGGGGSLFDILDTDHDGVITRSEFAAATR